MRSDAEWRPAPSGPVALGADEVHVWRASLRPSPAALARMEAHLGADERDRASRFRFAEHRTAFVAGRGAQREILARYTGLAPAAHRYRTTSHGKPMLDGADGRLRFNVSNAGDMALYAVTLEREIGVDLEALKPMPDGIDIAKRFFSAPENEIFAALPETDRELAFFQCWTRKEAYIKAVGEGLSMPLDRFDVSFRPGEPARLLATRGDPDEAGRWTLRELHPGPGYVGAIVVRGAGWTPVLFDFEA
ncbi:4'-phosphopantetheinyl transferase family protein [Longimicrobium terrae]|uniref:4'-phosphopantetheinyl transferase n=1 Tax=Longimicrobium terrae TaxID=1639882 RepID=A0A841H261_9BACT|nr:4'-phosphopantetheinyl transferase superfamily protein [Longimicrobium terrae]MBB4637661.1 4'-phosphopantetheinyl transferase [Longimicrobium terrae]MBB6072058.1 4'-phosphopantetheinyl transferase [Longimicrobium terrae]NNC29858.1 4'-phosphopantetheinyl transferase superfamily protein [Longimicrobium terrae]